MHQSIKSTHYLKARFALDELTFCKLIDYTKLIDPRLAEVIEAIHDSHVNTFRNIIDVVNELEPKTNAMYAKN